MHHQEIDGLLHLLRNADEKDQAAVLRTTAEHAYGTDLISYEDCLFIREAVEQGELCRAADRFVPHGMRCGVWRSAAGGWQAEVDVSATPDEWRMNDPVGHAVDCGGPATAIAAAALRARIQQPSLVGGR